MFNNCLLVQIVQHYLKEFLHPPLITLLRLLLSASHSSLLMPLRRLDMALAPMVWALVYLDVLDYRVQLQCHPLRPPHFLVDLSP